MKLTINGEEREIEEGTCLSDLLERLQLSVTRIAVERNGGIVHRSERSEEHTSELQSH